MSAWQTLLAAAAAAIALYAGAVLALMIAGRRGDARALAGFVPDCVVLFKRLIGDRRVARWRKALLGVMLVYLALPIDVVPDFVPVAGQLDDAILAALVLRIALRGAGEAILREHWPGPERSLHVIRRLAYGRDVTPPDEPRSAEKVEVLFFDGCTSYERLLPRLRDLAEQAGAEIRLTRIETPEEAVARRFLGSPTVRIDGQDIEPGAGTRTDYGLKCRIYRSHELGQSPLPPLRWISVALQAGQPPP